MTPPPITPVKKDSLIYNAIERKGCETGFMGKGKPMARCIYSVYSIGTEKAQAQVCNAWGQILNFTLPVATLEPYGNEVTQ